MLKNYKKSISLVELLFVIVLVGIVSSLLIPTNNLSKLNLAADKIILYLKYTRYIAMLDNKYDPLDNMWFKERWTLKFQKCSKSIGGLYYVIFSDTNHKGSPNKQECLKDPVTNKYLYSNYDCEASDDESKYILLTKEFGVTKVEISCNSTSTIGQISFGYDGNIYTRLGTKPNEKDKYLLTKNCSIYLYDENNNQVQINIEPTTGYISKK